MVPPSSNVTDLLDLQRQVKERKERKSRGRRGRKGRRMKKDAGAWQCISIHICPSYTTRTTTHNGSNNAHVLVRTCMTTDTNTHDHSFILTRTLEEPAFTNIGYMSPSSFFLFFMYLRRTRPLLPVSLHFLLLAAPFTTAAAPIRDSVVAIGGFVTAAVTVSCLVAAACVPVVAAWQTISHPCCGRIFDTVLPRSVPVC